LAPDPPYPWDVHVRSLVAWSLLFVAGCPGESASVGPSDNDLREPPAAADAAPGPTSLDDHADGRSDAAGDAPSWSDAGVDSAPDNDAAADQQVDATAATQDAGLPGAAAADAAPSTVDAAPAGTFHVKGSVSGLSGRGLTLTLNGGSPLVIERDGSFAFPVPLAEGSTFAVEVHTQPSAPAAACQVRAGSGLIGGRDAETEVACEALGGLLISEVGSCYYVDSACWFEIFNAGSREEQLADYQVRTPAATGGSSPSGTAAHLFALPRHTLSPGQYAVIAAASSKALPDGQGILHIKDGALLPWWSDDGFVELVSDGRSVDFVRFGGNRVLALTPGSFREDDDSGLPMGPFAYGFALARNEQLSDANAARDFSWRAFATLRAPNDVSSDLDADADGLPDAAELSGSHFAGLDLYAMGARQGVRDLFVEIDRMDSSDPGLTPLREALDKAVAVFATQHVALHFDVGPLFAPGFDSGNYNLGGGNVVPFAKGVGMHPSASGVADLYDFKAAHLAPARRAVFYYMLFGYSQQADGSAGSSGLGEVRGNDTIITLGGYDFGTSTQWRRNLLANTQAATMVHELGHNLGLRHGGDEDVNYKPNYLSIMNYLYSAWGLPSIGGDEGDRYDLTTSCSLWFLSELENSPIGSPAQFVIDFSHGEGADIDEQHVRESDGLGHAQSVAVDFDCSGGIEHEYAADLNNDGRLSTLHDHDDWANLRFMFARSVSSNDSGRYLSRLFSVPTDVQLDDTQEVISDPCPPAHYGIAADR
jgi:hypothetical protein